MTRFDTTDHAYLGVLRALIGPGTTYSEPRGLPCVELTDYAFTVERPSSLAITTRSDRRNVTMRKYLAAERALYLSGELRASEWAEKASKFWSRIANPDGTINSNYGYLMLRNRSLPCGLTPWEWALQSLQRDPDTRQAYVRVSLPSHQWHGNRDQVCTMYLMFRVIGQRLCCTAVMRSCDAVKGLAYDMPWFIECLHVMAEQVDLPVGTYTHFANSLHAYCKDFDVIREMLGESPCT